MVTTMDTKHILETFFLPFSTLEVSLCSITIILNMNQEKEAEGTWNIKCSKIYNKRMGMRLRK